MKTQNPLRQISQNPRTRRTLRNIAGVLLAVSLTACGSKGTRNSVHEIDGSQAERVAGISKLLIKSGPLPTPVLDARFIEEQTGDDHLGPADFAAFYALTVAPADLPAWRTELAKSKIWNRFSNDEAIKRAAPKKTPPWWVNPADLGALEFYSPHSLTGRANGWVGISPDGRIFIYAFTM